jgi:hypothetical protein
MSKFAIGEQVENVADDRESGTVVAVFPTVDGSTEELAFTVTRRGAA